jgi:hypothetical protein
VAPPSADPRKRSRVRDIAISFFVSFHLLALFWWNFGAIEIRSAPDTIKGDWVHETWKSFTSGVARVDSRRHARDTLEAWMRMSGTFQMWRMFSPDAPKASGYIAFFGITGYDQSGTPIVDPDPFLTTDQENLHERLVHIPKPPCGWPEKEMDDDRTKYFVQNYALFQLRKHNETATTPYEGVRYSCFVSKLPAEDQNEPKLAYEIVLWEGTP